MSESVDTIFAPASGQGRAAVAIIRLSGPGARGAVERLAGDLPPPRRLALRALRDPATGELLDQALVVLMPGPQSFTGEDQAELHIHGGVAVRSAVIRALAGLEGLRMAEPGEFTRRAFLNGRMDLAAVEGLADLIDAETEAQRRQALRQLEGGLGQRVEAWRERLIGISARLEAALDFSDEADVPEDLEAGAATEMAAIQAEMTEVLAEGSRGERLREGFVVVIAGAPNAGKSTLLNAIAKREVAIVSPFPGTTRDALEVRCDIGGLPVLFVDTAGLRDAENSIEREGVARAHARLRSADLVLWLVPPDGTNDGFPVDQPGITTAPVLVVGSKYDIGASADLSPDLHVSAKTGLGVRDLLDHIGREAGNALGAGDAVLTRERHRVALARAADALARGQAALEAGVPEMAAEDVRVALASLGAIVGRVDVDDVLGAIFAQFCIGK